MNPFIPRTALLAALLAWVATSGLSCADNEGRKGQTCTDCDVLADEQTGGDADTGNDGQPDEVEPPADPMLCVGIRGNGELIFAHFAALARIMEEVGMIDGAAGGSSASITMFLLESVLSNPAVHDCGGAVCTSDQAAVRAALLLKSIQAYMLVLADTPEAQAFLFILPIIERIQSAGIGELAEVDMDAARQALDDLLNSPEVADLVNDEVLDLIANSPHALWHAQDIIGALTSFGSFDATDPSIFIRPGILDFGQLARKIGRIANFYGGVGPADMAGMTAFLDACAESGRGLPWVEVAELDAGGGETCGAVLVRLTGAYREALLGVEDQIANRVDEPIGQTVPCLVSTSVLEGDAVTAFEAARAAYLAAEPYTFEVHFDDVRFGYWGPAEALATVASNPKGYTDLKTAKFRSLGPATWGEAMSFSPAEPGLARALEIGPGQVSAGGWSDLHPVLVLQNMGCDKVLYLTRRGGESGFAQGVAALLGMSPQDGQALYDLSSDSAFRRSLEAAQGVWCTDWNAFSGTQVVEISADAYGAPFETTDAEIEALASGYAGLTTATGEPGCTPGVAAP